MNEGVYFLKLDVFTFSRPELLAQTKTFHDPRFQDAEGKSDESKAITLTLRALDEVRRGEVQELAQEMVLHYCGNKELAIDPVSDFPPFSDGGESVKINGTIAFQAASLCVMQVVENEKDAYSFDEFVALSLTHPVAWGKILDWRNALNNKAEKQQTKN